MKRFIIILLTVLLSISAFACEPKKENVTVKGNEYVYEGENKMIAEPVLTLALEMFPIQLPMTEKAYNDLQTIEVANPKTATEWFYRNKEENKWLDVNDL